MLYSITLITCIIYSGFNLDYSLAVKNYGIWLMGKRPKNSTSISKSGTLTICVMLLDEISHVLQNMKWQRFVFHLKMSKYVIFCFPQNDCVTFCQFSCNLHISVRFFTSF